ncbi:MAG: FtsX-like permease family protein [Verrucomicrobiales bacterium]|nr:FtsX-like permease family protein [Verrucomicrobiales bacterium]
MKFFRELLQRWTWQMAWRDTRRDRKRLLLFSLSIIFGTAALVSTGSLRENLRVAIEDQARELLGADLMLSSRRPLSDEALAKFSEIAGERIDETSFMTMLRFVDAEDESRLVQVRAIGKGFPFYGDVVTEPAEAWGDSVAGKGIVLEQSLMDQFDAKPGDFVRIGELNTQILGYLVKAPPRPSAFAAFAPSAYLSPTLLETTELLGSRSLARYRSFFKTPREIDVDEQILTKELKTFLVTEGIQHTSIEERKKRLGRILDNVYSFLSLIGFMALILGGIGIAGAIHVHILSRIGTVATLRCIGCSTNQVFSIFLVQAVLLGVFGSILGTGLGIAVQKAIPVFLSEVFPFEFEAKTSWLSVAASAGISLLLCVSFALFPLIRVRRISPLEALRSGIQPDKVGFRDVLFRSVVAVLVVTLVLSGLLLSPEKMPWLGLAFVGGLGVAIGILTLIAKGISHAARRYRSGFPYTIRQGIANLHRPRNQTLAFTVSIGLGVFLIVTMLATSKMLSSQFSPETKENESNLFLIDVQPDQKQEVKGLIESMDMKVIGDAPMISMRLTHIKGTPVSEIQADEKTRVPGWIVRRDFRSTYRAALVETEELVEGEWIPRVDEADFEKPVPVSIEEGIAKDLQVEVGDELGMDVQGLPLTLSITSIRKVDWDHQGLNFFLVFPEGLLEEAPGFHILTTNAGDSAQSGALQREAAIQFPNVTVFDMSLILKTVEDIVERAGYVVRFMSLYTVGAGIMILVGTILSGQRDRTEESVLLRTLGASREQIRSILLTEYIALGLFAAITGGILSIAATWGLAKFAFKVEFFTHLWPVAGAIVLTSLLCAAFGMILSRGVANHPPLEVLRGGK